MNGRGKRNKGANAEREFSKLLNDALGVDAKRNLDQTREGGYDVLTAFPLAIEVKRQEKLRVREWWSQAVKQAGDKKPVLAYRVNYSGWRVVVEGVRPGYAYTATYFLDGFVEWVKSRYIEVEPPMCES